MSLLSIAPMIDWTNSPFRVWMRLLAPQALLYSEMQTTGAIINNPQRALYYTPQEHPIALQLGGADAEALVRCAVLAEQQGYDEVNLNLGCPSDRVQAGRFGACLMAEPEQVNQSIRALKAAVKIPITAKTRIGIDHQDSYDFFRSFVLRLIDAGCDKLIVHARKAWLHGLNPKQNRTIPPLHYDYVYQIKQELGTIPVVINGNISSYTEIEQHLKQVDGVMLGRIACDNPYRIAEIHHALYPDYPLLDRKALLHAYADYLGQHTPELPLSFLTKPLFNLAHGTPMAKQWKKELMLIMQSKQVEQLLQHLRAA